MTLTASAVSCVLFSLLVGYVCSQQVRVHSHIQPRVCVCVCVCAVYTGCEGNAQAPGGGSHHLLSKRTPARISSTQTCARPHDHWFTLAHTGSHHGHQGHTATCTATRAATWQQPHTPRHGHYYYACSRQRPLMLCRVLLLAVQDMRGEALRRGECPCEHLCSGKKGDLGL